MKASINSKGSAWHYLVLLAVALMFVLTIPNASADTSLNPFADRKIYEPSVTEDMSDFIKEDFNSQYGVIRLSKTFLWFETDKIAEYSLTHNTDQCLIDCEAGGKAVLYQDGRLFDDTNFKDKGGDLVDLDYTKYFIYNSTPYIIEVPDTYKEVCNETNKTICWLEAATYKKETRYNDIWLEYKGEELKAGEYIWKLEGKKKPTQSVDWISEKGGKEFTEWAWWNGAWSKKKLITLTANIGYISYFRVAFDGDMAAGFSDLRFINSTGNIELNYTIESYVASASAVIRVNNLGSNSFYMYYGSPTATTTSNASKVYYNPVGLWYLDEVTGTNAVDQIQKNNLSANSSYIFDVNSTGIINKSANFSRKSGFDNLNKSTPSGLPGLNESYTVAYWVKISKIEADGVHIMMYGAATSNQFDLQLNHFIMQKWGGITVLDSGSVPVVDRWYHVVYTWDGKTNIIYLNGSNTATSTTGHQTGAVTSITIATDTAYNAGLNGTIDEIGIWNRPLNETEILFLYNSTEPTVNFGAEETNNLLLALTTPVNYFNSSSPEINFTCNVTSIFAGAVNLTLRINDINNYTLSNSTNMENLTISKNITLSDGFYNWSCSAAENDYSPTNSTVRYLNISTIPFIGFVSPTPVHEYNATYNSLYINVTFNNTYFNNITFNLYNESGLYESSFSNTLITYHNFTSIRDGNYTYNVTLWTNTSQTNRTVNRNTTIDTTSPIINITTPSGTLYQPPYDTFNLNYSSSDTHLNNCSYSFNGAANISYSCKVNFTGINFTKHGLNTITLYANDTYGNYNSSARTFYVYPTMSRCNGTYSVQHTLLNFSFKDETTNTNMNASIDSSTFYYWYDDQNVNVTYLYSNATENWNYTFCVYPNWTTNLSMVYNIKFSSDTFSAVSYPVRTYEIAPTTYTNSSINWVILYLVDTGNSIFTTFQTMTSGGVIVPGVLIQIERQIGGIWTLITQSTTDDAGTASFWLNPNFEHKITATKTGYSSVTKYLNPTASTYTIILGSTGESGIEYSYYRQGLTYSLYPKAGLLTAGNYNFSFVVVYKNTNGLTLQNCSLELMNSTRGVTNITYHLKNSTYCRPVFSAFPFTESRFGRYSVKINGTWLVLEGDAHWINYTPPSSGLGVMNFINESTFLCQEWSNASGEWKCIRSDWGDDPETSDFSRIVFFFLIMAVVIAAVNFSTSYDTQYPGSSIYLIWAAIMMGSFANGAAGPGFFYMNVVNLNTTVVGVSPTLSTTMIMNNWIVAIFVSMIVFSMTMMNMRRNEGG